MARIPLVGQDEFDAFAGTQGRDLGTGAALPATGTGGSALRRGDVFSHTALGLHIYSGTAWRRLGALTDPVTLSDSPAGQSIAINATAKVHPDRVIDPAALFGPNVGALVLITAHALVDTPASTSVSADFWLNVGLNAVAPAFVKLDSQSWTSGRATVRIEYVDFIPAGSTKTYNTTYAAKVAAHGIVNGAGGGGNAAWNQARYTVIPVPAELAGGAAAPAPYGDARYVATAGATIALVAATGAAVPLSTAENTHADVTASADGKSFTLNRGGLWNLEATLRYLGNAAGTRYVTTLTADGNVIMAHGQVVGGNAIIETPLSTTKRLPAGTVIQLVAFCQVAGTIDTSGTGASNGRNSLALTYLRP